MECADFSSSLHRVRAAGACVAAAVCLRLSLGVGGTFGNSLNDSFFYVGGLPSSYWRQMSTLTAPSAMFLPRFGGYVRNVLYGNCSCMRRRAGAALDGDGFTSSTRDDRCDSPAVRHNCTRRCLCIDTDHGPTCDCSETTCSRGTIHHTTSANSLQMLVYTHGATHQEKTR